MLLICVLTYSFLTKNWKIAVGLILTFVIIFMILSPKFYIENLNLFRFASTEARLASSKTALSIWRENPMGVGFNTYRLARKAYEPTDWTDFGPSHAGSGVDNSFILVLVTAGFVGLGTYIYLLYRMFRLGYDKIKNNKYALVLVVSLVGLIGNSMFINSLFYSFLLFWIFVLAGLTERSLRE
jgi:O-antigen ligase